MQEKKPRDYVHIAAAVSEEMIRTECRDGIRKVRRVAWDQKEGRIVGALEERIGALLLSEKQFSPSDEEALPIICDADPNDVRNSFVQSRGHSSSRPGFGFCTEFFPKNPGRTSRRNS